MADIPQEKRAMLKRELEGLSDPVSIKVHWPAGQSEMMEEMRPVLDVLPEIDEKLTVDHVEEEGGADIQHHVDRFPALVLLDKEGRDHDIRFYGTPANNIMNVFLKTLRMFSDGDHGVDEELLKRLDALDENDLQVLVTPSAPNCEGTLEAALKMAYASEKVKTAIVEVIEFPEVAEQYRMLDMPKTISNEDLRYTGAYTLEEGLDILEKRIGDAEV